MEKIFTPRRTFKNILLTFVVFAGLYCDNSDVTEVKFDTSVVKPKVYKSAPFALEKEDDKPHGALILKFSPATTDYTIEAGAKKITEKTPSFNAFFVKAATKDNLTKALNDPTDKSFKLLSKVSKEAGIAISYESDGDGDAIKVKDKQTLTDPSDLKATPTAFNIEFTDVTFKSGDADKKTKITIYVADIKLKELEGIGSIINRGNFTFTVNDGKNPVNALTENDTVLNLTEVTGDGTMVDKFITQLDKLKGASGPIYKETWFRIAAIVVSLALVGVIIYCAMSGKD